MSKKILMYSESLNPRSVASILTDSEIEAVGSKQELVVALVEQSELFCFLAQLDSVDDDWHRLLSSISSSFPVLETAIITGADQAQVPRGYAYINGNRTEEETLAALDSHISGVVVQNKRRYHRFDWPLQGYLSFDSQAWETHRVRSISAGGAYLESDTFPDKGTNAALRIEFQDFQLTANCEILDPRQSSSNLPPGFGVRFLNLSEQASGRLEEIVNDALIHALLEPEEETPVPSIGGEELLPDAFSIL